MILRFWEKNIIYKFGGKFFFFAWRENVILWLWRENMICAFGRKHDFTNLAEKEFFGFDKKT